jgi:hypothetical protein
VYVLEAPAVAAGDDDVHALVVLDGEVAHRPAVGVRDAEAQRAGAAALELAIGELQREAAIRDGETADGVGGGLSRVALVHFHLLLGVGAI